MTDLSKKRTLPTAITDERVFWGRRKFLNSAFLMALATWFYKTQTWAKAALNFSDNKKYQATEGVTPSAENLFLSYNNFYEFSFDKDSVKKLSQSMSIDPWEVEIAGLVEKPFKINIEELIALAPLESRVYRFRCVETWAAVVPWVGYPLSHLIKKAKPQSAAKYVRFESYFDKSMPNFKSTPHYPWPYSEGLRMDEASNDLTLLTFGAYGKPLAKQNGAPVRIVVPWKYGFKSAKSIKKIEFVAQQPKTMWNELAANEYGFYANVNPAVDHPRWSQKNEKLLGQWLTKNKTIFLNGYEKEVGKLYQDMDLTVFF